MVEDEFFHQYERYRRYVENLLEASNGPGEAPTLTVQELTQEFFTVMEELQVAAEELRQQNEELSQASQRIEIEQQRYQDLFEFAPDGYLVTDGVGKILEANRAAGRLANQDPQRMIGKPIITLVALPDRKKFRTRLAQIAAAGLGEQAQEWEVRLQPRGGGVFCAALAVSAFPEEPPAAGLSLRWMVRDISERVRDRQALQQARDELEARVVERTAQLRKANEELRYATSQLERRNRELQEFAFIASHDLQEPLRKILKLGELLRDNLSADPAGKASDYLNRILRAAHRMQAMVTGLLGYARISAKLPDLTPVDLGQVATEVLSDLEALIASTQGQVEIGPLPNLRADPLQMRQLFQNLIGNALKFHQPGRPPQIKVYARQFQAAPIEGRESAAQGMEFVDIFVEDNGIGFDPAEEERIFEPFQRLHGRSQYEGSGMGLPICRRIAEQHSGRIAAQGRPGEGATFIVTLPL